MRVSIVSGELGIAVGPLATVPLLSGSFSTGREGIQRGEVAIVGGREPAGVGRAWSGIFACPSCLLIHSIGTPAARLNVAKVWRI